MKKQYIEPNVNLQELDIESLLAAASPELFMTADAPSYATALSKEGSFDEAEDE